MVAYRRPRLLRIRVLGGSRGLFSATTVVCQAVRDKPNSSDVQSGPGYLGSICVCRDAHWGKLSDSWPKSNSPTSTLCYCTLYNINSFSVNNINIYIHCYINNINIYTLSLYKVTVLTYLEDKNSSDHKDRDRYLERLAHSLNTAKIQNYNFACCFVWVWNLVANNEGGTWAEGVWE